MAKEIRDPLMLIGMIERGETVGAFKEEMTRVLSALNEIAGPKGKAKGKVSLVLDLEVQGGACAVSAEISSKTPKMKRAATLFFVTPEGELTQEHPTQIAMFPHDAETRRA